MVAASLGEGVCEDGRMKKHEIDVSTLPFSNDPSSSVVLKAIRPSRRVSVCIRDDAKLHAYVEQTANFQPGGRLQFRMSLVDDGQIRV